MNLDAWMGVSTTLDTLKKVSGRSGVGFGTVRRARNGDGNTTIQNLAAIARAFGRKPEDLLRRADYPVGGNVTRIEVQEPAPLMAELMTVVERMNDRGLAELIGRAKELALQHPRVKANRTR